MAGFQKFPVPKYLYIDFWNYNKKWLGDTFFISLGGMLTFLSLHRFLASRIRTNEGACNVIDPSHEIAPQVIKF